jgi:hypothetical protein
MEAQQGFRLVPQQGFDRGGLGYGCHCVPPGPALRAERFEFLLIVREQLV